VIACPATIQMDCASQVAGQLAVAVNRVGGQPAAAGTVDCAALVQFDSSALAALLHAKRAHTALGSSEQLKMINVPENLRRLAQLYGVEHLLFS
jgi:phospholipid transport system transporter-binding protein